MKVARNVYKNKSIRVHNEKITQPKAKEIKRRTVAGPWKNVAEFKNVCNWLYGPDVNISTRQKALYYIKIWCVRRSTLCPAAILATGVLLEIQLKDETRDATKISEEDLSKLYAHAFMRFFNFMSSIMQFTNNVRSMYETAKELGLPSFVVDLRHTCAHGQLIPPLIVLRNTALYCIKWLYDYYWKYQEINMCDVNASKLRHKEKTELDENIYQLFAIYDTALEVYMKGAITIKLAKRHVHGKRFQNLKSYYMEKECSSISAIFDHIAENLNYIMKRHTNYYNKIKDLSSTYIEAILKMNYFFYLNELELKEGDDLSRSLQEENYRKKFERLLAVTQSMFRMLALNDLLIDLFEALLEIAESSTSDYKRKLGARFWSLQIIEGLIVFRNCKRLHMRELESNSIEDANTDCDIASLNITELTDSLREILVFCGIDRKTTLILSTTIHRPWVWRFERDFIKEHLQNINTYTKSIMKRLLELMEPKLNNTDLKHILAVIDIYLSENNVISNLKKNNVHNATTKIYTVNDVVNYINRNSKLSNKNRTVIEELEKDKEELTVQNNKHKEEERSYGIWSVLEDEELLNWKTCPLGTLPWE